MVELQGGYEYGRVDRRVGNRCRWRRGCAVFWGERDNRCSRSEIFGAYCEEGVGLDEDGFRQVLADLRKKRDVTSAYPVFPFQNARLTLTDVFVARFNPETTEDEIQSFNKDNKVEIVRELRLPNTYLLRVAAREDSLATDNAYHESELTAYATPDFIRFLTPQFEPDDVHYPNQWGMENDGTNPPDGVGKNDSDIDASKAWDISTGSPETIIAIIDEGVELDHEDLAEKIVAHYSAIPNDEDGGPNNDDDAHGTNCAGIAAAATNNSLGVAGICPDCSLMSVQIAHSVFNGIYWITKDSWIAEAIIWAVDNGADVLSNSWGGGSVSTLINEAITYATTNGRDGLGSLVLFAAGTAITTSSIRRQLKMSSLLVPPVPVMNVRVRAVVMVKIGVRATDQNWISSHQGLSGGLRI